MICIIKIVKTRSMDAEEKNKEKHCYPEVKLYVLEDLDCEDKFHRDTVKMQLRFSLSGVGPQIVISDQLSGDTRRYRCTQCTVTSEDASEAKRQNEVRKHHQESGR